MAELLASDVAAVIVGVLVKLLFASESLVETIAAAAVSSGLVVSDELLMPIPAAINPPSPPATEDVLVVRSTSKSVGPKAC